jgi:cytochrome d ubiquinol oxidase subunit II
VLFAAFPAAFARVSIALHVPISLMLAGIVLRGSAFVFRAYGQMGDRALMAWGRVFAAASTITPLLIGAIVGAVTEGRIDPEAAGFMAAYMDPWLTPFAIAVGVFALVLFAYLAAVYLTLEGREAAVVERFRVRALAAGVLAGVLALGVFLAASRAPHVRAALTASPWAVPLHAATGASALAALWLLWTRRFWWARVAAAAQVTLIVWGWALAQYPYLVRPDLTIASSAAPESVLEVLLVALLAGAVVLIPSLVYLFRVFAPNGGDGGNGSGRGGTG